MRYIVFIFYLFNVSVVFSQSPENSVCYVTFVKGEIRKPSDKKIIIRDTVMLRDIPLLNYVSEGSLLTLHHPKFGSFQLTAKESPVKKGHESFIDFLAHLLKVKGRTVSLSSRGGCECSAPQSCFFTDTTLNDKVLLVDSLSFAADGSLFAADAGYYFLQYNIQGRKPLIKRLKMTGGIIVITPKDLVFEDSIFTDGETDELVLGLFTLKGGQKNSSFVAFIKFKTFTATALRDYYAVLQTAMQGHDRKEIYETFCKDVYTFFGKPNDCQLNRIINYPN